MIRIEINSHTFFIESGISVLEACELIGVDVPRFCYHQSLSIAGNCRMCLVEIFNSPKPVASCALPILNNMKIFINSPLVKKARENVLETLLLNHPLDCPICDQGGECDLQDQSKNFGLDSSRFFFRKRAVEDKVCNPLIKTIMTRCIHCTRCVRFNTEISGYDFLGTLNRGSSLEIGSYIKSSYNSTISANIIDLCPVGALTSKPYSFKARPWELRTIESIDLTDSTSSWVYISSKESSITRIFPKSNNNINESFISDKARFFFDSNDINRLGTLTNTSFNLDTYLINSIEKKIALIVDSNSDFEALFYSKNLEYVSLPKLTLATSHVIPYKSNYYISWLNASVSNMTLTNKVCFLISSNIKLESSLINTKLRIKALNNKFNIFGFSSDFNNNLDLTFLNFSTKKIYLFFSGKGSKASNHLLKTSSALLIFSDTFFKRGGHFNFLVSFLKKSIPNLILLNINININIQSLDLLNIRSTNSRHLLKATSLITISLEDTFFIKRYLLKKKNQRVIWFNSHDTLINKNSLKTFIKIGTLSIFEENNIFQNFEQRFQKSIKVVTPMNKKLTSIKEAFMGTLKTLLYIIDPKIKPYQYHIQIYKEILYNYSLTTKLLTVSKPYTLKFLFLINVFNSFLVSYYPCKNLVEDFYLLNKNLKNSISMQLSSQFFRKSSTNFFIRG